MKLLVGSKVSYQPCSHEQWTSDVSLSLAGCNVLSAQCTCNVRCVCRFCLLQARCWRTRLGRTGWSWTGTCACDRCGTCRATSSTGTARREETWAASMLFHSSSCSQNILVKDRVCSRELSWSHFDNAALSRSGDRSKSRRLGTLCPGCTRRGCSRPRCRAGTCLGLGGHG